MIRDKHANQALARVKVERVCSCGNARLSLQEQKVNAQEHEPRRIVRFGLFELDRKSKELHHNGMKIKLSAQPFQVLILPLEHAGDVVTREELRQQLYRAFGGRWWKCPG